jgi:hypothetical protein
MHDDEPSPLGLTLTRTITAQDENGGFDSIELQIFIPENVAGHEEPFGATAQFRFVGTPFTGATWTTIHGVDQLDAILNCLDIAAVHLRSFRDTHGLRLSWFGDDNLGLPAPFSRRE